MAGWPATGVPLCTASGNQYPRSIVSDGHGGAIVVWVDERDSLATLGDLYAQHVRSDGSLAWTTNGSPISFNAAAQDDPVIATDGAGGCVAAWVDARNGPLEVFAAHLDSTGAGFWGESGVRLSTRSTYQYEPAIAPDSAGGAYVAWIDSLVAPKQVRGQHVRSNGTLAWDPHGVLLSDPTSDPSQPVIVSDYLGGGGIFGWHIGANSNDPARARVAAGAPAATRRPPAAPAHASVNPDAIVALRLAADGTAAWPAIVTVCAVAGGTRSAPAMISDLAGGAIVGWSDTRFGPAQAFVQRVTGSGGIAWSADGVEATNTMTGGQGNMHLATDGASGAYVVWQDGRAGNLDIYGQLVRADGNRDAAWSADGVAICQAVGDQQAVSLAPDGLGAAFAAWQDGRSDTTRVYATHIGASAQVVAGVGPGRAPSTPAAFRLSPPRPNPARGTTRLDLDLPAAVRVDAAVFDVAGRRVRTLLDGTRLAPGRHTLAWDGRDTNGSPAPDGVYFMRVRAGHDGGVRRVVMLD